MAGHPTTAIPSTLQRCKNFETTVVVETLLHVAGATSIAVIAIACPIFLKSFDGINQVVREGQRWKAFSMALP